MDFNYTPPKHVELKVTEPESESSVPDLTIVEPSEHVELEVKESAEHVELVELKETKKDKKKDKDKKSDEHVEIEVKDESPEELELDYKLGNRKYVPSDRVWTHKAWYIVEALRDDVLYLVREDVWKERQKKAEHVELTVEEEKPSEIVVLDFE
jgi:hypothetical protein